MSYTVPRNVPRVSKKYNQLSGGSFNLRRSGTNPSSALAGLVHHQFELEGRQGFPRNVDEMLFDTFAAFSLGANLVDERLDIMHLLTDPIALRPPGQGEQLRL